MTAISKSISLDTEQYKQIIKWMEYNGVKSFSVACAILFKRGLSFRMKEHVSNGKHGVGVGSQRLIPESSLSEKNQTLHVETTQLKEYTESAWWG